MPDYMNFLTDINEKMRCILLDWLIEVHLKFKLRPETLFLTVNIIDRCLALSALARFAITKHTLQLLGVTALMIASKFEEIYPPVTNDYVYITDKAYTKEQVLRMEGSIL